MAESPLIEAARADFHTKLLSGVLTTEGGIPSNADRANRASINIANQIINQIGADASGEKLSGQGLGSQFEQICENFLSATFLLLGHLRPGNWYIRRLSTRNRLALAGFEQYQHLDELNKLASESSVLASALGTDYIISPDIVIGRMSEPDNAINAQSTLVGTLHATHSSLRVQNNDLPILHASISCKWTIRSDRAQNARSEALNLIRNRKGKLPHIVAVTGEPLPSRIASLALGTGDIDCVYHFALPELVSAVTLLDLPDAKDMLDIMISGRRLRDISDLPLDLAT